MKQNLFKFLLNNSDTNQILEMIFYQLNQESLSIYCDVYDDPRKIRKEGEK